MVTRSGHSLPELVVAVTFLATAMLAVGGAALTAARWTHRATAVEAAVRVAEAVLDSIATAPSAMAGGATIAGLRVRWTTDPGGDGLRVQVRPATGSALVELRGVRVPVLPALPDAAVPVPGGAP